MKKFKGYKVKQKRGMSHWSELMKHWILAIERYTKITGGIDAPYIYNERANTGVLAAAAWMAGWIALEEYQSEKAIGDAILANGRVDLYLATQDTEEILEAKFRWICMGSNNLAGQVDETMSSAVEDARSSRADSELQALAAGFFPVYKSDQRVDDCDTLIDETIAEFGRLRFDVMGWCFPAETRGLVAESTGNRLPGIVFLAKNIKHA